MANYKRTGKQLQIPEDELISIVLDRLDAYAALSPAERRDQPNPATNTIVARVRSGRMIEIPNIIVDKALEVHRACGKVSGPVGRLERLERRENMSSDNSGVRSGSHTRLDNRTRYSEADPFIMDEDLRGQKLIGNDSNIASDAIYRDYPDRYAEFNDRMNRVIDESHIENDLDDVENPLNSMASVKYNKRKLAHVRGPSSVKNSMRVEGDYMDDVTGMTSDISPEGGASVYAGLDDETYESSAQQNQPYTQGDLIGDYEVDYDSHPDYSCKSCETNNGYVDESENRRMVRPNRDDHPYGDRSYGSYPSHDDGLPSHDYKADVDKPKSNYNAALWIVLIILITVLVYNYRKQN